MAISHKHTLICEEVRREDNGKLMIIGVYNEVIVVPQIPFVLPSMTFVPLLNIDTPRNLDLRCKVQVLETGQTVFEGRVGGHINPGPTILPIRFGNVSFQAIGAYNFVLEIEGLQEPAITQFEVRFNI